MAEDVAKRVQQFIAIRDALDLIDERYKNERKPLLDAKERLEGIIAKFLDDNNLDNVKTEAGTAYKSVRYSATLSDPDAFMDYVIRSERYELLDRRANSTAVRAFVEEAHGLPPGCNLTPIQTLVVRRK